LSQEKEVRRGWCGPCHIRCGLLVEFEGGKAVSVRGDPNDPLNRGQMCERGRLILEHLYHPDRLNYPLKRAGRKGEGKWQRIEWGQAMEEISLKLAEIKDRYGAEALAFSGGTRRTYGWAVERFYNLFGSPNVTGAALVCMCPSHSVDWSTYGYFAVSDVRNTALAVVWGSQRSRSQIIPGWRDLLVARKKGMKLIVIDPVQIEEAKMADMWLQIRPGTDLALMLGWIRLIIQEGLYDKEFVEKWTLGFDHLWERVKDYTPEKVAEITWVAQRLIVESARIYATTKPAVLSWGLGIDLQGVNAIQAARGKAILRAITGNLDVRGGELLGLSQEDMKAVSDVELEANDRLSREQVEKQLGAGQYRLMTRPGYELISQASKQTGAYVKPPQSHMTCKAHSRHIWNAITTGQPYPVKALIAQANNPLVQAADTKLVYQALKSPNLELMVVMDYYMTPTAELADYVLPAAGTLERADFPSSPKAMEPLYQRGNDYSFWRELGVRLGQEQDWPWKTIEEVCDYQLRPLEITFAESVAHYGWRGTREYKKYEKHGFGTPSGKVEISSSIFGKLGYEPVPVYREPPETPVSAPELARDYPLILISGPRFLPMYHSELRQIPSARQAVPDPLTSLHPETAAKLGIGEGDWVWIETLRGRIKQKARLTEQVHRSMVCVQHGWWFPEKPGQDPELHGLWDSNANVLCPVDEKYCSPETGGWPHTSLLCRVNKA